MNWVYFDRLLLITGLKLILWFEPERAMEGTELWAQPQLYTKLPPAECRLCDQDPSKPCGLLDVSSQADLPSLVISG